MDVLIFDIETNAVENFRTLLGLKTIHCIAVATPTSEPEILPVDEALERMRLADILVGHNIQDFDIRAIQRLYPDWVHEGCVRDTLILSRMLWPDIQNEDWQILGFPKKLVGSHSLKAWGERLGVTKGDFAESANWDVFTDEMAEYCCQDVRVTQKLWERISKENPPERPTVLEHEFAALVSQQQRNGFAFDVDAARKLHSSLLSAKADLQKDLQSLFPPQTVQMKTPIDYYDPMTSLRYKRKKDASVKIRSRLMNGELRVKTIPFNPASRDQIAKGLINKHEWSPVEFTGEGRPKVDEAVLSKLDYPEARKLIEYLTISKRLGQLAEGAEAWMKSEVDGRIHGYVNPCGAITGRCTHRSPNMAQVPRVGAPWGKECRSLFTVPSDCLLVGVDASGLELRCLAHYTEPFDGGEYINEILNGDIHTANQEAAGLPTRDDAKTFIYALCYGAGDSKIGSIIGGGKYEGLAMKKKFYRRMPALKKLQEGIKYRLQSQDHLTGVDGRKLRIRSSHSALNTLLQSAGAVAMKEATCLMSRAFSENGWTSDDVKQVAHIHDEVQFQVRKDIAEDVGKTSVQAIQAAGRALGFRCLLDGAFKVGRNWAETH